MTDAYVVGVDMIKFGRFPDEAYRTSARNPHCWPWMTVV